MFGINTAALAKSIRGDMGSVLDGLAPKAKPLAGGFGDTDWMRFLNLKTPSLSTTGVQPVRAAASAPPAPSVRAVPDTTAGAFDQQRAAALSLARDMFGPEGERQLNTTFDVEGGWNPATIGDTHINPIGSHGPLQFYGGGGQLNNFAAARGIEDLTEAGRYVRQNPLEAIRWALNNYYGNSLRQGMDNGLRGEDLAQYIQEYGQRSQRPERAREVYRRLYGG